jgi:hypothetical protein
MQAALSATAQRVFADPANAAREDIVTAADELNGAYAAAVTAESAAQARYDRENLDLVAKGDIDGSTRLAQAVLNAQRYRITLRDAVNAANARLEDGAAQAEVQRQLAIWNTVLKPKMAEREAAAKRAVDALKAFGVEYIALQVSSDQIWGALPHSVGVGREMLDSFMKTGLQQQVDWMLATITHGAYDTGAGTLHPPGDVIGSVMRDHRTLLASAPALRAKRTVITAEEFERRVQLVGKPELRTDAKLTEDGYLVAGRASGLPTVVDAEEFERRQRAADASHPKAA